MAKTTSGDETTTTNALNYNPAVGTRIGEASNPGPIAGHNNDTTRGKNIFFALLVLQEQENAMDSLTDPFISHMASHAFNG